MPEKIKLQLLMPTMLILAILLMVSTMNLGSDNYSFSMNITYLLLIIGPYILDTIFFLFASILIKIILGIFVFGEYDFLEHSLTITLVTYLSISFFTYISFRGLYPKVFYIYFIPIFINLIYVTSIEVYYINIYTGISKITLSIVMYLLNTVLYVISIILFFI